jgi:hypothetical protein
MRKAISALVLASPLLLAGCGRDHLSAAYGRAHREAFSSQPVHPAGQPAQASMSLDAQESSVIASSYIRSLAGKAQAAAPEPVLFVAPQQPGATMERLAPSVPKE